MQLLSQIKEDWITHEKEWTRPGFRAIATLRFGQWRMTIKNKLVRIPFSLIYRLLYRRARNVYGIEIPYTVEVGRRVKIEHQGAIVIHGYSKIGDDCIIRQGVSLGNKSSLNPFDAPTLGNRVDIGAGAKLLGKISIGDDVFVGANAVVTRDVDSGLTVAGIPAKPINRAKPRTEAEQVEIEKTDQDTLGS